MQLGTGTPVVQGRPHQFQHLGEMEAPLARKEATHNSVLAKLVTEGLNWLDVVDKEHSIDCVAHDLVQGEVCIVATEDPPRKEHASVNQVHGTYLNNF